MKRVQEQGEPVVVDACVLAVFAGGCGVRRLQAGPEGVFHLPSSGCAKRARWVALFLVSGCGGALHRRP